MADFPGLNKPGTGLVNTNSFNLTRVTAALSLLIGAGTIASGATATQTAGGGAETTTDWLNFDSGQRLVIVVSVVAAWAMVTSADLLARSITTGRADAAKGSAAAATAEATVIPLRVPLPAARHDVGGDVGGRVFAMRGGNEPAYLFARNDGEWEWVQPEDVRIKKSRRP